MLLRMKEMLEKICKNRILTSLETIHPNVLHSRKKVMIFSGVDANHYYHAVFRTEQKSRFIFKHAQEIIMLEKQLALHVKHAYKFKHLIVTSDICSKASKFLKDEGWRVVS